MDNLLKIDYVAQTRAMLGPFNFDEEPEGLESHRELRDMVELEDGSSYKGEWLPSTVIITRDSMNLGPNGVREGRGILIWPDGSIYEGWIKGNQAHGKGRLIHAEGYVY